MYFAVALKLFCDDVIYCRCQLYSCSCLPSCKFQELLVCIYSILIQAVSDKHISECIVRSALSDDLPVCCFYQACTKPQPPHQAPAVPPPTLSPTQTPPGASWCHFPPATAPPPSLAPCPMASPAPAPFWEKAPWSSALAQTQARLLLAPAPAQSLAHCTTASALATAGASPYHMPTMAQQRLLHQPVRLLKAPSLACPQQCLHQVCCVMLHLPCRCQQRLHQVCCVMLHLPCCAVATDTRRKGSHC